MGKVQLALLAWQYRRELLITAAVLFLLPFLMVSAVTGAFLFGVPMVPDRLIPLYQQAAEELTGPDGTPVPLAWQALVGLDAVRYRQDWNQVTEEGIRDLAELYVEEVDDPGGAQCTEGSPYCRCWGSGESRLCLTEPHTRYDRRGDLDVMDILGFSDEEKRQALFMGTVE